MRPVVTRAGTVQVRVSAQPQQAQAGLHGHEAVVTAPCDELARVVGRHAGVTTERQVGRVRVGERMMLRGRSSRLSLARRRTGDPGDLVVDRGQAGEEGPFQNKPRGDVGAACVCRPAAAAGVPDGQFDLAGHGDAEPAVDASAPLRVIACRTRRRRRRGAASRRRSARRMRGQRRTVAVVANRRDEAPARGAPRAFRSQVDDGEGKLGAHGVAKHPYICVCYAALQRDRKVHPRLTCGDRVVCRGANAMEAR
ncbi:Uncharacterised protein [Xylophilus ampelinus]|nr:Uncharacterised protein [Xylophilus ampelinus]